MRQDSNAGVIASGATPEEKETLFRYLWQRERIRHELVHDSYEKFHKLCNERGVSFSEEELGRLRRLRAISLTAMRLYGDRPTRDGTVLPPVLRGIEDSFLEQGISDLNRAIDSLSYALSRKASLPDTAQAVEEFVRILSFQYQAMRRREITDIDEACRLRGRRYRPFTRDDSLDLLFFRGDSARAHESFVQRFGPRRVGQ